MNLQFPHKLIQLSRVHLFWAIMIAFLKPPLLALEWNTLAAKSDKVAVLRQALQKGLSYMAEKQVKQTIGYSQFAGEWESYMVNIDDIPFLGPKGKTAYDSNSFVTSSVHQSLVHILESYPEAVDRITPMLENSVASLTKYKNGETYNFWSPVPWAEHLVKKGKKVSDYPMLRVPNNYPIKQHFVYVGSNPVNDADDTALAFLALKNNALIAKNFGKNSLSPAFLPEKIGAYFSPWRDRKRHNVHFINLRNGQYVNTGAFLTWLHPEEYPTPWSFYKSAPDAWIPFGVNDVDCVVNSNVLQALAVFGEDQNTPGVKSACKYVNEVATHNEYHLCGVYYPNRYNVHYTAAKAYAKGVACLQPAIDQMIFHLLSTQ